MRLLISSIGGFFLSIVSIFLSGEKVWAEEERITNTYEYTYEYEYRYRHRHRHGSCKSGKVMDRIKSMSVAVNELTCNKVCEVASDVSTKSTSTSEDKTDASNISDKSEVSNVSDKSNCDTSDKSVKTYSETDNDHVITDRSWDNSYNHSYKSDKDHIVLICRDVNLNENFEFGNGNDKVIVKGSLAGGNNFNLGGGDDEIAILGDVKGNVSINGDDGVDVLMLGKGLDSYTFNNFTNNNGIISAQIIDNSTNETITINNMEGLRFGNSISVVPISNTDDNFVNSISNRVLSLNKSFAEGIGSIDIVKENGNIYIKYNNKLYDAVVFSDNTAIVGEKSLGLLWREN